MQEPDDTSTNGFKVSSTNIVFSSPPASGDTFWAVYQGQNVDIGTPSDGVVGVAQLSATGTASATTFLRGDNSWQVAGITSFPFFKADASADNIAITNGQFPFYKADGSLDNIGVT